MILDDNTLTIQNSVEVRYVSVATVPDIIIQNDQNALITRSRETPLLSSGVDSTGQGKGGGRVGDYAYGID